jgi:hypothetical protein
MYLKPIRSLRRGARPSDRAIPPRLACGERVGVRGVDLGDVIADGDDIYGEGSTGEK